MPYSRTWVTVQWEFPTFNRSLRPWPTYPPHSWSNLIYLQYLHPCWTRCRSNVRWCLAHNEHYISPHLTCSHAESIMRWPLTHAIAHCVWWVTCSNTWWYLLTCPVTDSLTHSFTHSLNHLLAYLFTHSLTHSLTHPLMSSLCLLMSEWVSD